MNESNLYNIIENFRNQFELKKGFIHDLEYTDELFYEMLELVEINIKRKFSYDEKIEIKKNVDSKFQIYQPNGDILVDPYDHDRDWFTKSKEHLDNFYWKRYRKHLFDKGWTTQVLDRLDNFTLDSLMNYLGDPLQYQSGGAVHKRKRKTKFCKRRFKKKTILIWVKH